MSFGVELLGSFNNDAAFGDLHGRTLLALAMTAGVPLENNQLAEIVVRIGAVRVDSLQFVDDNSRLVRLKNEVPQFNTESGLGVDAEVNVPISETLGYLFIRATVNSGFDPNPWSTLVGYTIPFGSLGIRP